MKQKQGKKRVQKKLKGFKVTPAQYIIDKGLETCEFCMSITNVVYCMLDTGSRMCPACFLKKHIPVMVLSLTEGSTRLFNQHTNVFERDGIEHFRECGWFVREKQIARNVSMIHSITTYILEYYGERACPRCNIEYSRKAIQCNDWLCKANGTNDDDPASLEFP